ncbi:hypothetical protein GNI_031740 [Gregarina niphandrodes]|uniref:Uncharacterized protein n=1 Tax=Gregarina niphandrodes TaxID=110365 RepID=A0A023BAX0_GRENI|nr:hypothetical protein GNI_031740 [Gregarina niphandrodes]EZG78855.1 hypothetical protein GNI_031740 [Gregarina niphandrodes]|eukprot:XP_011129181.1 hypothetical protein GNI_031740 [Gregarina niphandrodes]
MDMDETGVARAVFLPGVGETRDGGESGVQLEDLVPVDLAPVHFPPENQAPEDQVPGKHPDAGLRSKAVLDVCEKTTLADTSTGDGGSPALKPDLGHLGLVDAPIYVVPEPRRRGAFPSEAAPDRVEADTGRKRSVVCSEMHQAADVLVERMQSLEEQISLFEDTAGPLQQTQHVLTPAFYDP